VRIAQATVSWDEFQNYVQFLQQGQVTVPPKVISGLANAGSLCGR
jgi:hypothetical protein